MDAARKAGKPHTPDHRNHRGLLHLGYAALYVSAWNLPPVT